MDVQQKLKYIQKYFLILFPILFPWETALAQRGSGNLPYYYNKRFNFGFFVSLNKANLTTSNASHFERFDSLRIIESLPKPGLNVGFVAELKIKKYLTLRFVPSLSLVERNLEYSYKTFVRTNSTESTITTFPVDLKLRSKRVNNFGAYLLAGGGYAVNWLTKQIAENKYESELIVNLKKNDFFYEVGTGAEFYFEHIKFAIEGKMSNGVNNLLIKDNTIFSNSVGKLNSHMYTLSLTLEGLELFK
jgi:hypothetical protein